jgi:UPF0755 protein
MRRFTRLALAFFLLCLMGVGYVWWALHQPLPISADAIVQVPRGASIISAIDTIDARVSLPSPSLIRIAARLVARVSGKGLQAGWYTFHAGDTQLDVLRTLFNGDRRNVVRVTIPEGLTYREMAAVFARTLDVDTAAFIAWCENDSITESYAPGAQTMEGYLMPDTYDMFWREDPAVIGMRLAEEFRRRHKDSIPSHEEVILASIVQAEAVHVDEMPRIAGVYANRIKRGMKLEADPTVQYGLGMKDRLLYRHLNDRNAYNTYQHPGLPPGPINNPGLAAIAAARHPERHTFLFFVAAGDGSGRHVFAVSGSQHMKNVAEYRRRRGRR